MELTRADGRRYKPLQDLMQQAREFLDALIRKHPVDGNDTVLIVGHNAILRCLIVTLLGEPEQGFRRLRRQCIALDFQPQPQR